MSYEKLNGEKKRAMRSLRYDGAWSLRALYVRRSTGLNPKIVMCMCMGLATPF